MNEHQQLECKQVWKDEFLKVICAFANSEGGRLVIGRADDGAAVGVSNARKLLEDIPNKVRDVLGIIVDVSLQAEEGVDLVVIEVGAYPNPVSYKGEYFYRTGSTNQALKGAALERFLLRKRGLHWDGLPIPGISQENLSPSAFALFRRAAAKSGRMDEAVLNDSNQAILENLQLIEGEHLRRAATLLFHDDPERFVPGAYVKIGFFRTDADLVYQDEVHGCLFEQAQKTLDLLLTKYMKAYISYEGITRVERFLFPKAALREVLLNALVHRDYSTGVPIQIRVYENRIRFSNDGRLPDGWTLEKLLETHASKPANPLIAGAFFRTGDIESWGRGIDKIREACTAGGADFPTFDYEPTGLTVEFKAALPEGGAQEEAQNGEKTRVETRVKTRVKILELLRENRSMTRQELAEQLGLSLKGVDWQITQLKKSGDLRRVGSRKGGHWEVVE